MATKQPKKYYWLKLQKDFFKRHDIRIIESMPNGKDYIIFYLKLLTESISHDGQLRFSEVIPYESQMLSVITNTNPDIVKAAIEIFKSLNLMEVWDDKTIYMTETTKMLGTETEWAIKKREYKARQDLTLTQKELPNKFPYKLKNMTVLTDDQVLFENGVCRFVDEKRYGGNGKIVLARSDARCEMCGIEISEEDTFVIHHDNGYSNKQKDLMVLCKVCHGKRHTGKKSTTSPLEVRQEIEKELEIDIELDKEIDIKKESIKEKKAKSNRFVKPTVDEIKEYVKEKYDMDGELFSEKFFNFYESKGWMVGRSPMKDWRAAVRNWAVTDNMGKSNIDKLTEQAKTRLAKGTENLTEKDFEEMDKEWEEFLRKGK